MAPVSPLPPVLHLPIPPPSPIVEPVIPERAATPALSITVEPLDLNPKPIPKQKRGALQCTVQSEALALGLEDEEAGREAPSAAAG